MNFTPLIFTTKKAAQQKEQTFKKRELDYFDSFIGGPYTDKQATQWINLAMATWGSPIKESTKTILNNYVLGEATVKNIQKIPTGIIARYITSVYPNISSQQQKFRHNERPVILSILERIRAENTQRRKKQSQQQKQKMQKKKQVLRSITVTSTLDQINKCQVYDIVSLEYRPIKDVLDEHPNNAFVVFTHHDTLSPFQPHLFFRKPELPVTYRNRLTVNGSNDIFNVLHGTETILIRQIDLAGNNNIYFAIWEEDIKPTGIPNKLPLYRILKLRKPNKVWNIIDMIISG
jgi:hypothetical protein